MDLGHLFLNSVSLLCNVQWGILYLRGFVDHWNPVLCQIVLLLRSDLERDYRLVLVVFFFL